MGLSGDERGQSIQVGAILLFAMLIIAFSTYQAFVVPDQNQQIEFNHNQEVHEQMQDLRNAIVSLPGDGGSQSVSVELGTTYPSRAVAVNPGPPSGTLRTAGSADTAVNVSIRNATATDSETDDYWSGTARNYSTGAIVYSPQYNLYDNAPETVYDQTVLYNQFRDANVTLANQTFIDGNEISLVTLNGSFSRSSSSSTTVDVRSVTTSTQTVEVNEAGSSSPVTLVFASKRDHTYWDFLESKSNVDTVKDADDEVPPGYEGVKIKLDTGTAYELHLTKVGVGSGVTEEDAAYLTGVEGNNSQLQEDETTELVLEVRNRYNHAPNNSSATTVYAEADSGTFASTDSATASMDVDSDGQVRFVYNGSTAGVTDQVNFSYVDSTAASDRKFEPESVRNVTMVVDVKSTGGGGGGGGSSDSGGSTGAGGSGTSTYSSSDDSEVVTDENGRWDNIKYTDQLRFSGAETIIDSSNDDERLITGFTLRNDSSDVQFTVKLKLTRPVGGGPFNTKSVTIKEYTAQNTRTFQSSISGLAANRTFNESVYNGTNILNPEIYTSSFSLTNGNSGAVLKNVTDMDGSDVTLVFSEQTGRTNLTLWDRTLITAVEPDPDTPAALATDDKGEFVALHVRTKVDLTGWELVDDEGETTDLSTAGTLDPGVYYFAKDESEFETRRGLADGKVYSLNTDLEDDADALKLVDAEGDWRDEFAYENGGSAETSNGTTVTGLGKGEVANRTSDGVFKQDNDTAKNWKIEDESAYFDRTANDGVAFANGGSLRSYAANEVVTKYGVSVNAVGPKTTDFIGGSEAEIPFINTSGTNPGLYLANTTGVKKVKQSNQLKGTGIGVGNFDGDGNDEVYFIKQQKIKEANPTDGSPATCCQDVVGSGVKPKAIAGVGDVDGDSKDEIVFWGKTGGSNQLLYADGETGNSPTVKSTGYTNVGSNGNSYGMGPPRDIDGDDPEEIPVVNESTGNLEMVDQNGNVETELVTTGTVELASIATFDINATATGKEIIYLNNNDELTSYDFSDDSSTVLVDTADNTIVADTGVGVR